MNTLRYLGTISRAHGIKGDCYITDVQFIPTLTAPLSVTIGYSATHGKTYTLESIQPYKKSAIARIRGCTSMNDVELFRELGIFMDTSFLVNENKVYFDDEILGAIMYDSTGVILGTITDIWQLPTYKAWVVTTATNAEVAVPVIDQFIKSVNKQGKSVIATPPDGLFETL